VPGSDPRSRMDAIPARAPNRDLKVITGRRGVSGPEPRCVPKPQEGEGKCPSKESDPEAGALRVHHCVANRRTIGHGEC
jgi:hypothetical protein